MKPSKSKKFYITTTLPYVNAAPHIGFAHEFVLADVIARYRRLVGDDVFFNTGTDEHGLKIYRKALEEGRDPQEYVDKYSAKFRELKEVLNLSYNSFMRTTNPDHENAAQKFWKRCDKNGDIYKKTYKAKYCVGCELEKTDSELENGHCSIHPNLKIEIIDEENYFFKFSRYQDKLLALYIERSDFVLPDFRLNEVRRFVEGGLQDFSISRVKAKMPWGVPVPGDEEQVMYVWFDALVNYISALGWPEDKKKFEAFWGTKEYPNAVQVAGKDNLRPQSAIWQAMLMSADLPVSKQIIVYGFITSGGQKISKSLGNVVNPYEIVEKYGTDALRYWLVREISLYDDGDFTWEKFKESYNANLANGLGNLVSRVMKMAVVNKIVLDRVTDQRIMADGEVLENWYEKSMNQFNLQAAANGIWEHIQAADFFIQKTEPFKKIKIDPDAAKNDIKSLMAALYKIAVWLRPFMPDTSNKILEAVQAGEEIKTPLFPRL